jgi:hypothetical protein
MSNEAHSVWARRSCSFLWLILLNDAALMPPVYGAPGLFPAQTFPLDGKPVAVTVRDLNHDGISDVAAIIYAGDCSSPESGNLSV